MTDLEEGIVGLSGLGIMGAVAVTELNLIANLAEHVTEAGTKKPKKKDHNINNQEWLDMLF